MEMEYTLSSEKYIKFTWKEGTKYPIVSWENINLTSGEELISALHLLMYYFFSISSENFVAIMGLATTIQSDLISKKLLPPEIKGDSSRGEINGQMLIN